MTNIETPNTIEQIGPDVTLQHHKDFLIYTVNKLTREAVDAFIDHAKQFYSAQPVGTRMYMMCDTGASSTNSLSPYFRKRIEELTTIAVSRELKVMVAVVLPRSYMLQIAMFFVQKLALGAGQVRFFFAREDGLRWLESMKEKQSTQ
jgi:hypothetical protein